MVSIRTSLPWLLLVFGLSVLVRVPQWGRPLATHHESATAMSLRILEIWYDQGISASDYNPNMNYALPTDKHINNQANASGKMVDQQGNYYYVSHPPFAYYFAYTFFKLIHIRPTVRWLQAMNMMLHFLTALFVYFTVCLLSFNSPRSQLHFPSFIAYSIYLFMPSTLWFQGNVFMSDLAVQLPFVIGVYIVLKMILRKKFTVPKYLFWYSLNLFVLLYTSWLGVFFVFGVMVYSLLHVRELRGFRWLMGITVLVSFIVFRMVTYQYAQINGLEAYIGEVLGCYVMRGSIADLHQGFWHFLFSYFLLIKNLFYNYLANYLPIFICIGAFIWLAMTRRKLKIVFSENGYRFVWLSVLPIILLHVFFLQYSSQDFTVLYASFFFSVFAGIIYDKVKKSGTISPVLLNRYVILFIVIMIIQYTLTNLPGDTSIFGSRYDADATIGTYIHTHTRPDQVAFIDGEPRSPIVYYAGRNIQQVTDIADARAYLADKHLSHGVLYHMHPRESRIVSQEEIILP
jgi:hypothetical protein